MYPRNVQIIHDSSSKVACKMTKSIIKTLGLVAPSIEAASYLVNQSSTNNNVPVQYIFLLTGGVLSNTSSMHAITSAVEQAAHSEIICVYKECDEDKWDWSLVAALKLERSSMLTKVQGSLWGHEAYKYRAPQPEHRMYEHQAFVTNMVVRMPAWSATAQQQRT